MSRANNSARLAGSDMNNFIGYVTTVADVTQKSAESVGNSFNTIYSRFGNVKAGKFTASVEDQQSADYDAGNYESLNDIETVLTRVGIKLRDNYRDWRNIDDVLSDIAEKWDTWDGTTRNAVATVVAGTRQRENVVSLFENWDNVQKYAEIAQNAYGTATQKMEAYSDSIEASKNRMTNAIEKWSLNLNQSDVIKSFYDGMTFIIENAKTLGFTLLGIVAALNASKIISLFENGAVKILTRISNLSNVLTFGGFSGNNSGNKVGIKQRVGAIISEKSLAMEREAYGQALQKATIGLNQETQIKAQSIQYEMLALDNETKKVAADILESTLTEDELAAKLKTLSVTQQDNLLRSLLVGVSSEELQSKIEAITADRQGAAGSKKIGEVSYTLVEAILQAAKDIGSSGKILAGNVRTSSSKLSSGLSALSGVSSLAFGLTGGALGKRTVQLFGGDEGAQLSGRMIGGTAASMLGMAATKGANTIIGQVSAAKATGLAGGALAKAAFGAGTLGPWVAVALAAITAIGGVVAIAKNVKEQREQKRIELKINEFNDAVDEFNNKKSLTATASKFDELSKGVDRFGNNISLSDDEYEQFIEYSNQLCEAFPELTSYVDSAGNKIAKMGDGAESASEQVKGFVDELQADADRKMLKPEVINTALTNGLNEYIENYNNNSTKDKQNKYQHLSGEIESKQESLDLWENTRDSEIVEYTISGASFENSLDIVNDLSKYLDGDTGLYKIPKSVESLLTLYDKFLGDRANISSTFFANASRTGFNKLSAVQNLADTGSESAKEYLQYIEKAREEGYDIDENNLSKSMSSYFEAMSIDYSNLIHSALYESNVETGNIDYVIQSLGEEIQTLGKEMEKANKDYIDAQDDNAQKLKQINAELTEYAMAYSRDKKYFGEDENMNAIFAQALNGMNAIRFDQNGEVMTVDKDNNFSDGISYDSWYKEQVDTLFDTINELFSNNENLQNLALGSNNITMLGDLGVQREGFKEALEEAIASLPDAEKIRVADVFGFTFDLNSGKIINDAKNIKEQIYKTLGLDSEGQLPLYINILTPEQGKYFYDLANEGWITQENMGNTQAVLNLLKNAKKENETFEDTYDKYVETSAKHGNLFAGNKQSLVYQAAIRDKVIAPTKKDLEDVSNIQEWFDRIYAAGTYTKDEITQVFSDMPLNVLNAIESSSEKLIKSQKSTAKEIVSLYDECVEEVETAFNNMNYDTLMEAARKASEEVFADVDAGSDGIINTYKELNSALEQTQQMYNNLKSAQQEYANSGKIGFSTALKLLAENPDYIGAMEAIETDGVVTGYKLTGEAAKIASEKTLEALRTIMEARVKQTESEIEGLKVQLAASEADTKIKKDYITKNIKQQESIDDVTESGNELTKAIVEETKAQATQIDVINDLTAAWVRLCDIRQKFLNNEKLTEEDMNFAISFSGDYLDSVIENLPIIDSETKEKEKDLPTESQKLDISRSFAEQQRLIEELQKGNFNATLEPIQKQQIDAEWDALFPDEKEINDKIEELERRLKGEREMLAGINQVIANGGSYEDFNSLFGEYDESNSNDTYKNIERLKDLLSSINKEFEAMQAYQNNRDTTYFTSRRQALTELLKEYSNAMAVQQEMKGRALEQGLDTTQYDKDYLEALNGYQDTMVEIANLDDEEIEDKISLLEMQGQINDEYIDQHKLLRLAADDDKDRAEYAEKYYSALQKQRDVLKDIVDSINEEVEAQKAFYSGNGGDTQYYKLKNEAQSDYLTKTRIQINELESELENIDFRESYIKDIENGNIGSAISTAILRETKTLTNPEYQQYAGTTAADLRKEMEKAFGSDKTNKLWVEYEVDAKFKKAGNYTTIGQSIETVDGPKAEEFSDGRISQLLSSIKKAKQDEGKALVDLRNYDDEETLHKIEMLEKQGIYNEMNIELYKILRTQADTEEERIEYANKYYDALVKQKDILKDISSNLDKEYMQAAEFDGESVGSYYQKKLEADQAVLKSIESILEEMDKEGIGDTERRRDLEKERQDIILAIKNLDDEELDDMISMVETQKINNGLLIDMYSALVKASDTEQERIENMEKLNDKLREQAEIYQTLLGFYREIIDFELQFESGTPNTKAYADLIDNTKGNLKAQIQLAQEMAKAAYDRKYASAFDLYTSYGDTKAVATIKATNDALQDSDYQSSIKDYINAFKEYGDLYIQDFENKVDYINRKLNRLQDEKPQQWASVFSDDNQVTLYSEDQIRNYYNSLNEVYSNIMKLATDALKDVDYLTDEQVINIVDKYNEAAKAIHDNAIQMAEDVKEQQETKFSALTDYIRENYIDDLQKQKEIIEDVYGKEIEKLNDKAESIERTNKLIELQNNLLTANKEKERVYREGIGWVMESPRQKIKQAQKEIDDFNLKDSIDGLNNLKDAETKALDDRIKAWEDYLELLQEKYQQYDKLQQLKYVLELTGAANEEEAQQLIMSDMQKFSEEMAINRQAYLESQGGFYTDLGDQSDSFYTSFNDSFKKFAEDYQSAFETFFGNYKENRKQLQQLQEESVSLIDPEYYIATGGKDNVLKGNGSALDIPEEIQKEIEKYTDEKYKYTPANFQGGYDIRTAFGSEKEKEKEEEEEEDFTDDLISYFRLGWMSSEASKNEEGKSYNHQMAETVRNSLGYLGGEDGSGFQDMNKEQMAEFYTQIPDVAQLMLDAVEKEDYEMLAALAVVREFKIQENGNASEVIGSIDFITQALEESVGKINAQTILNSEGIMKAVEKAKKDGEISVDEVSEAVKDIEKTTGDGVTYVVDEQGKEKARKAYEVEQAFAQQNSSPSVSTSNPIVDEKEREIRRIAQVEGVDLGVAEDMYNTNLRLGEQKYGASNGVPILTQTATPAQLAMASQALQAQGMAGPAVFAALMSNPQYKAAIEAAYKSQKGFADGIENGPVTYTGLTMLHGSLSKPEYVLNSDQAYNLLRYMSTTKPAYESTQSDGGVQYIVQGDVVLENCDDPAAFWNEVTNAMSNRYSITKNK